MDMPRSVWTDLACFYQGNELKQAMVYAQVSVDLFVMSRGHVDLATLGSISRMTAGQLYHYHPFHASIHGPQLLNDLRWNVTRPQVKAPLSQLHSHPPTGQLYHDRVVCVWA